MNQRTWRFVSGKAARVESSRKRRVLTSISDPFTNPQSPIRRSSPSAHWSGRPGTFTRRRWDPGGIPVIVSSFALTCITVQVGVIRRSVRNRGSESPGFAKAALVMMTEISIGVGWNAMLSLCINCFCLCVFLERNVRVGYESTQILDVGCEVFKEKESEIRQLNARFHNPWSDQKKKRKRRKKKKTRTKQE